MLTGGHALGTPHGTPTASSEGLVPATRLHPQAGRRLLGRDGEEEEAPEQEVRQVGGKGRGRPPRHAWPPVKDREALPRGQGTADSPPQGQARPGGL